MGRGGVVNFSGDVQNDGGRIWSFLFGTGAILPPGAFGFSARPKGGPDPAIGLYIGPGMISAPRPFGPGA